MDFRTAYVVLVLSQVRAPLIFCLAALQKMAKILISIRNSHNNSNVFSFKEETKGICCDCPVADLRWARGMEPPAPPRWAKIS